MSDSLNEAVARQTVNRDSPSKTRRDKPQTLSGIEATKSLNLQTNASFVDDGGGGGVDDDDDTTNTHTNRNLMTEISQNDKNNAELVANLAHNRARSHTIGCRDSGIGGVGIRHMDIRDERKHSCDGVVSIDDSGGGVGGSCSSGSGIRSTDGINSGASGGSGSSSTTPNLNFPNYEFTKGGSTRRRESLNYDDTSPCSHSSFNKAIFGRTAHNRAIGGAVGGGMTRKCVLTLDGYSYVIVASTPESIPKRERDDLLPTSGSGTTITGNASPIGGGTSGNLVSERRSKVDSPTGSSSAGIVGSNTGISAGINQTSEEISNTTIPAAATTTQATSSSVESVTINGQIGRHGSLTIVRRSNSRKSFIHLDAQQQQQQNFLASPSTTATTPIGSGDSGGGATFLHQQQQQQQSLASTTADSTTQAQSGNDKKFQQQQRQQKSANNLPASIDNRSKDIFSNKNSNSNNSHIEFDTNASANILATTLGQHITTNTGACVCDINHTNATTANNALKSKNSSNNNPFILNASNSNSNLATNIVATNNKMQSEAPISPNADNIVSSSSRDNGDEGNASEENVVPESSSVIDLATENLPAVDTPDACDKAAVRLRCLLHLLNTGNIANDVLQRNLHYAARVLEAVFLDESKRLADEDDELSEVQPDAVPPEVREWLASTFTRQSATTRKRTDEKPKFRTVAHAIRAGIFVDRIYRSVSRTALMQFPPEVVQILKNLDDWSFDVFALAEAASGQPIKYLSYDLLNRYGIIHKFKIAPATLETFLNRVEEGYCRYRNPYHNNIHAADVTQTTHYVLCQTGLMNWLTDLEIFATLLAALIHDFEHTGTTNNFHVMSGSEKAMLYNDRAVLENHHVSAAFRLLKEDDCNILVNLSREEFREFRTLIIDMVLATDMSFHFQQLKNMRNLLTLNEASVDKSKAMSLVLHCCDISHPAKRWNLHHRWTMLLFEEFFRQGDLERELGLPFSPMCDRNNILFPESQIGFIDFIVEPSLSVMSDMLEYVLTPLAPMCKTTNASIDVGDGPTDGTGMAACPRRRMSASVNEGGGSTQQEDGSSNKPGGAKATPKFSIRKPWLVCLNDNKKIWKEQSLKEEAARNQKAQNTEGDDKEE